MMTYASTKSSTEDHRNVTVQPPESVGVPPAEKAARTAPFPAKKCGAERIHSASFSGTQKIGFDRQR